MGESKRSALDPYPRDFKGVWIPKEIWLDERLNALDKVILAEVDSLDKEKGCYASNEYIGQFCQCSAWKVSTAISKLVDLGYIRVESFDGRQRTLKSCFGFFTRQPLEKPKADFGESQAINIDIRNRDKYRNNTTRSRADSEFTNDGFDKFWSVYPRKDGKQDAIKAWRSLKPSESLQQIIIADVQRRIQPGGVWYKSERRFIKTAAPYLRGRRWEDEQVAVSQPAQPDYSYVGSPNYDPSKPLY